MRMRRVVFERRKFAKFRPILELDSDIDLTKITTYLHFYEFNSLQSQCNLFYICFAKQMLLMINSNANNS